MSWPAPTGEPIRPQSGSGEPIHPPSQNADRPPATAVPPSAATDLVPGAIQTLAARPAQPPTLAPLSERSGQPVRPWTIWVAAGLLFSAAITVTVGLLIAMWTMASPFQQIGPQEWTKDDRFNQATWLTTWFPSEPATGWRVFFAIACCAIAVLVAGTAAVVGYYAFAGYRWTRIGALVTLGVTLLTLLLNPIAAISIGLVALAAVPLWLPASTRFFARWLLVRHPQVSYTEPIENVFYGPLPRYR